MEEEQKEPTNIAQPQDQIPHDFSRTESFSVIKYIFADFV
jgi:hypothetical protein